MKVKELMTGKPLYATLDMELPKVAKMMADHQVGMIPVVIHTNSLKVIGGVTDRDIVTRAVALGMNPLKMKAMDVMSSPVLTVKLDDDLQEVAHLMERHGVRRVPVIDEYDNLCGMIALADIALKTSHQITAEIIQSVSQPTQRP